ncbi:hypothetical protein [Endozoicomonas atrinae]|uniref:hypothetical protein n=1 Tax=Endozoicomonas atrinae TaxID=1333660 RepID=UPI003B0036B3
MSLKKLSQYYSEQIDSENKTAVLYKKNKSLGLPYLAGTSGMCSCFYAVYPLLEIEFNSRMGRQLAEVISAFIVAIGFHTFQECYDAFNLTDLYRSSREVMVAAEDETGVFNRMLFYPP